MLLIRCHEANNEQQLSQARFSATVLLLHSHETPFGTLVGLRQCFKECPDVSTAALFNPKMSVVIQKRHFYTGNLNSETLGDSKNTLLHWGDVSGQQLTVCDDHDSFCTKHHCTTSQMCRPG